MRTVVAAVILAIPAGVLGGLAGFAVTRPDDRAAACRAWAADYARARNAFVLADLRWKASLDPGQRRQPYPEDVRSQAAQLAERRPDGCSNYGRLTR